MITLTRAQKIHFIKLGQYFGYPACCTREFLDNFCRQSKKNFYGTGFVPCNACNKKDPKEVLAIIQARRKHSKPFPREDKKEVDEFVRRDYEFRI